MHGSRGSAVRSTRFTAARAAVFVVAVTLLTVLLPGTIGLHPGTMLSAPYKRAVGYPTASTSQTGCATQKGTAAKWAPSVGLITTSVAAAAKTCSKVPGPSGGVSSGYHRSGLDLEVPFRVASNGNHSIFSSLTVAMSSAWALSGGPCKLSVNYGPSLGRVSEGYCKVGTFLRFDIVASLVDLNNTGWVGNSTYGIAWYTAYSKNYSYCYNYGTPSCYNSNGTHSFGATYTDPGVSGFTSFTFNGTTTFGVWTNGTNMVKPHHYDLSLSIYADANAWVATDHVIGPWAGSASSWIDLATMGHGVTLVSISIA